MYKPKIGDTVLIKGRPGKTSRDSSHDAPIPTSETSQTPQDEPAVVCYVHSDLLINVGGFDCHGDTFRLMQVGRFQPEPISSIDVKVATWAPMEDDGAKPPQAQPPAAAGSPLPFSGDDKAGKKV